MPTAMSAKIGALAEGVDQGLDVRAGVGGERHEKYAATMPVGVVGVRRRQRHP